MQNVKTQLSNIHLELIENIMALESIALTSVELSASLQPAIKNLDFAIHALQQVKSV